MSIYQIIRDELDSNIPLYGAMTNAQVAAELNAVDKVQNRSQISGAELFGYTDETEYAALTDAQKTQWLALCAIDNVTTGAVPLVKSLFPQGTTTWANIVKTETVSRASQIGAGKVKEGYVAVARAL